MSSLPSPPYDETTGGDDNNYVLGHIYLYFVAVFFAVMLVAIIIHECRKLWCESRGVSDGALPQTHHHHHNPNVSVRANRETLAANNGGPIRDDQECAICLEGLVGPQLPAEEQGYNVVMLRVCRHVFHLPCILKWIARNKLCPVCRQVVDRLVLLSAAAGEANTNFADNRGSSFAFEIV